MRFLVAHPGPHFSVHDLYVGWTEALRTAGQTVFEYNLHDRLTFYTGALLEAGSGGRYQRAFPPDVAARHAARGLYGDVMEARPHVLLVISGFFTPPHMFDVIRAAGVRVVLVCTESPYQDARQADLAEHADLTILNDPANIERFPPDTHYFPHAYRPALHRPGAALPHLACDFAFVGTGYPSRVEFFEQLDLDGLDVLLAGNWRDLADDSPLRKHLGHEALDCLDNTDAADVYRSARVGLNLYRREADQPELSAGWAMGPREVEMAACGAFFLRDPRGEGDEVLDMLPTFTGPADASDQLRWWLAHPEAREAAAEKARVAVADRTFDNHARRLLRLLERK